MDAIGGDSPRVGKYSCTCYGDGRESLRGDSSTALPAWGGKAASFSRKELKRVQFRSLPREAWLFAGAMVLTRTRVAPLGKRAKGT